MCTVVFIPGKETICLGSLRDESPLRKRALPPELFTQGDTSYISPKDPLAGGTWIGVSNAGNAITLLNGGFENHKRKNYYGKSRGLIVTELLASKMPVEEWGRIDTENIEPFTLIVWNQKHLFQLVWDGSIKHRIKLDKTMPHIWSSSTLYNTDSKTKRQQRFKSWIDSKPAISAFSLFNFFQTNKDAENRFIINRNETVKTLSFSFIELRENINAEFSYYDFSNHIHSIVKIDLQ